MADNGLRYPQSYLPLQRGGGGREKTRVQFVFLSSKKLLLKAVKESGLRTSAILFLDQKKIK